MFQDPNKNFAIPESIPIICEISLFYTTCNIRIHTGYGCQLNYHPPTRSRVCHEGFRSFVFWTIIPILQDCSRWFWSAPGILFSKYAKYLWKPLIRYQKLKDYFCRSTYYIEMFKVQSFLTSSLFICKSIFSSSIEVVLFFHSFSFHIKHILMCF